MTIDQSDNFLKPIEDGLPTRSIGDWSLGKLHYLEQYLFRFINSMRPKQWRSINYIDLFAGPGKDKTDNNGKIYLGSPLIALSLSKSFDNYYFSELDENLLETLKNRCSASNYYSNIRFYPGDANRQVTAIVNNVVNLDNKYIKGKWPTLNLAFLDPEGLELNWNTIKLLSSVRHMDLIIYYPQMGITREAPNQVQRDSFTSIDAFFGDDEWRNVYRKCNNKDENFLQRKLLDLYKYNLYKLGYSDIPTFEPVAKNSKQAPLYRLIFASKHPLGSTFWNDVTSRDQNGQMRML